jgi:hypothetical protein
MTREECKKLLLEDKMLHGGSWIFTRYYLNCNSDDNCCFDVFKDVEDALDSIEHLVGYDIEILD